MLNAVLHLSMHEEAERQHEARPSRMLRGHIGEVGAGKQRTDLVAMWAEFATGRCMNVFLGPEEPGRPGRKTWRKH